MPATPPRRVVAEDGFKSPTHRQNTPCITQSAHAQSEGEMRKYWRFTERSGVRTLLDVHLPTVADAIRQDVRDHASRRSSDDVEEAEPV